MKLRFLILFCVAVGTPALALAQTADPGLLQNAPTKPRNISRTAPIIRPAVNPSPGTASTIQTAIPVTNPNSPLGTAISQQCSTGNQASDFVIPGAKGDIRLDNCYQGRDRLSCEFNVLKSEATSLIEKYRSIVEANYPEVQDVSGMCQIQSGRLSSDLQNAREFADRFAALKAEYEWRSACAARIEDSVRQATLNDLHQAPNLLKSILDSMDAEMKDVSDMQGQISAFAERMAVSQRAMGTLEKVHRAVCIAKAPTTAESNTMSPNTKPSGEPSIMAR